MTALARAAALLACVRLAACATQVVELEPADAGAADGASADAGSPDASACRCRITHCRVATDCALTGGTCPVPDGFCTGAFASCRGDQDCSASAQAVCTAGPDSTAPCP